MGLAFSDTFRIVFQMFLTFFQSIFRYIFSGAIAFCRGTNLARRSIEAENTIARSEFVQSQSQLQSQSGALIKISKKPKVMETGLWGRSKSIALWGS